MRRLLNFSLIVLFVISANGCNNGDDEPNPVNEGGGTLMLSGDEAHYTSGMLEVNQTAYGREDLTGLEASLVAISSGLSIPESADDELLPTSGNLEQQFVIVASEIAISMSIFAAGTKRDYISDVSNPVNVTVNTAAKEVIFANAQVINADNGSELTLNGTLTW